MTKDGLRQHLRAATRQGHHSVDHHPLMRPLTAPGLTVQAYGRVLHALLGLHQPLETAFHQAQADLPELAPFTQLPLDRSALLTRDLGELAILDWTAPCWNGTAPTSVAEYVGWRYVVEGSVMGVAMLGPRIREQLGQNCPLHFFGRTDAAGWHHFCGLAETLCPPEQYPAAGQAACRLFADTADLFTRHLTRHGAMD